MSDVRYNPNTGNLEAFDQDGVAHRVSMDVLYKSPDGVQTSASASLSQAIAAAAGAYAGAGAVKRVVSQSLTRAAFTDNTDTTGFIDITTQLPAGAIVLGWKATVTVGFTGDTTAVIKVGKAGALADYSAITTASVLAAASVRAASAAATSHVNAATTIRVTVTGTADFTSIAAGTMVVTVYYIDTEAS